MCTEIFLPEGDYQRAIETGASKHGALSSLGNIKAYGWLVDDDDADPDWGDDTCLCGVDVEAILERNNVIYGWDPCGYNVFKTVEERDAYDKKWGPNADIAASRDAESVDKPSQITQNSSLFDLESIPLIEDE